MFDNIDLSGKFKVTMNIDDVQANIKCAMVEANDKSIKINTVNFGFNICAEIVRSVVQNKAGILIDLKNGQIKLERV